MWDCVAVHREISIHALRVEGDLKISDNTVELRVISIHALRVEGDSIPPEALADTLDFYPRPPGGGRLSLG